MQTKPSLLSAAACVVVATLAWLWPHALQGPSRTPPPEDSRPAELPASPARPALPQETPPAKASPEPHRPTATLETTRREIEEATVQYSVTELPKFEAWLKSPDPSIRSAAADGLVQSGLAAGAVLLRDAAAASKDPHEIEIFLEGASVLELPPATDRLVEALRNTADKKPLRHFNMRSGSSTAKADGQPADQ